MYSGRISLALQIGNPLGAEGHIPPPVTEEPQMPPIPSPVSRDGEGSSVDNEQQPTY